MDKLIAGLAQVGRQADAIEIYHETRRGLRDELGVAPGRRLQETYHALLAGGLGNGAAPTPAVPAESPRDHVGPAANGNGSTRAPDSTAAIPAQLPRNVSSFVAREAELRWLLDRIAPGESGKPVWFWWSGKPVSARRHWPCVPPSRPGRTSRTASCS